MKQLGSLFSFKNHSSIREQPGSPHNRLRRFPRELQKGHGQIYGFVGIAVALYDRGYFRSDGLQNCRKVIAFQAAFLLDDAYGLLNTGKGHIHSGSDLRIGKLEGRQAGYFTVLG